MATITLAYLSPEYRFLGVAVISAWLVLMCLKTIGHGYYMSVCWHNLKVETHNLRIQHERELRELKAESIVKAARKLQIQQNPIKSSTTGTTGGDSGGDSEGDTGGDGANGEVEPQGAVSTEQAA